MKQSQLALTLTQRLLLFFCIFLVCYIMTAAAAYVLGRVLSHNPAAMVRISAMLQDVLTFIVPAVLTAVIVTRRPAELLSLTRMKSPGILVWIVVVLLVSMPLQEAVIYWNNNIHLPESMTSFERLMKSMEDAAAGTIKVMLGDTSTAALILNILVVGIAAGFAEELLFRGCFQRLLTTGGVNPHVAIWVVAVVFSAMHLQFFGFVPRMLLGAYFGYLLLWSGSLWAPVAAHILNNTIYVVTAWYQVREKGIDYMAEETFSWSWTMILLSAALTAVALWRMRNHSLKAKA